MSDDTPTLEAIRTRVSKASSVLWHMHAPRDIAFLFERDAAREKRLAEAEDAYGALLLQITDIADHILGMQEVAPAKELLSRVAGRANELRLELAGIRERARTAIRIKRDSAAAYEGSTDSGDIADADFLRDDAAEIERIVGDMGEPAAGEGVAGG